MWFEKVNARGEKRQGAFNLTKGLGAFSMTQAFRSRFELSHIDTWATEYHPSFGAMVLDGNSWSTLGKKDHPIAPQTFFFESCSE